MHSFCPQLLNLQPHILHTLANCSYKIVLKRCMVPEYFPVSLIIRWQYGLLTPTNAFFSSTWFKRLLDQTDQLLYCKQARIFCHGKFVGYFWVSFFHWSSWREKEGPPQYMAKATGSISKPVSAEPTDAQVLPVCQLIALRSYVCPSAEDKRSTLVNLSN